jgi:hypothetical protein
MSFHDNAIEAFYCIDPGTPFVVRDSVPNPGGNEGFFTPHMCWEFRGEEHVRSSELMS